MDPEFETAALAIYAGQLHELEQELTTTPGLATRRSSVGHPSLLQLVACEEADLADPVGAAGVLVERGAETWHPVVAAAGCNSVSVLRFLIDSGAPFDREGAWNPLEEALYWASREAVDLLVARGARPRSLAAAAGLGDRSAVEAFLAGDPLRSDAGPLRSPFPDTVPAGLAYDPAAIVDHAFVMAVNCGELDMAELLLAAGARVNQPPPGYHWQGTALHAAMWRGDEAMVAWLLSVGADPSIRDGLANADAAGWANHHGHPELLALLKPVDPS